MRRKPDPARRQEEAEGLDISKSIPKKDHEAKFGGHTLYVADHPTDGVLFGRLLRSQKARARILNVTVPPLPEGYCVVDHTDVPGENRVHIVKDDTPVFAEDTVEYIGDPILMVVGPNEREVERLLTQIQVHYEELPPVFDPRKSDVAFFEYGYTKGDPDRAFAEADRIFEEVFETGQQEQVYLETNGMVGDARDGRVTVHGSMQCPYYVHTAIAKAMGYEKEQVRVKQDPTGGGFGGKEDYPSVLGCQVAVASLKAGAPVRVVFDRREDIEATGKRHPSIWKYRLAVKDGRVTAMDIDAIYDAGAYTTLSAVVLQRGVICSSGVYTIENLTVHGRAMKTNTVPNGAFRGFGAPQTFFAVEMMMTHVAEDLGMEPLSFKERHLAKQGDATSTGGRHHFRVPLPAMIEEVDRISGYRQKSAAYSVPQTGRYRKGVGFSLWFHGAGFTGAGERDLIKARAKLKKYRDGTIEALTANTDMGQGLKTTFAKIIAKELGMPPESILVDDPDTDRVPDSGPTVASRSLMIVGELLRRAAVRLKAEWKDGEEQTIEERYVPPEFLIPFSLETFSGDAYPTYAWGAAAVELEVDTLTGLAEVLGVWSSFDVGTPIDENIVVGQMEGGILQSIGHAGMEQMAADASGRIRNNSLTDYIIPTSMDVRNIQVKLHVEEYPEGPYGAKGAGELPAVGPAAAYAAAMGQALSTKVNRAPFSAEDVMRVLREEKRHG